MSTFTTSGESARIDSAFRLGFFTRLVDDVDAAEVYRRALKTFTTADELGFDAGWVAQHHAKKEGGLPSPLVFLTAAAARTTRLVLATGIITLPLENPIRVAEDASVLDVLSNGRLELGFGTGGNEAVFSIFGRKLDERQLDYEAAFIRLRDALDGKELIDGGPALFPPGQRLAGRLWEATFGVEGAIRAAQHGSGLLLARTALRPTPDGKEASAPHRPLGDVQAPFVDAYLQNWRPTAGAPRIGLSRSVYVAPTRKEAFADAEHGIRRFAELVAGRGGLTPDLSVEELLTRSDVHIGSPDDVITSLRADRLLATATDLTLQVHPVDPPLEKTLRSLELIAREVAPALGWRSSSVPAERELVASTRN